MTAGAASEARVLGTLDRVLVVAPHPDDDVIGCGAALAYAARSGARVRAVYVTDGSASHPRSLRFPAEALRSLREDEARDALGRVGVKAGDATFLRAPDGALEKLHPHEGDVLVGRLAAAIDAFAPTVVLAPWRRDPHPDHRAVAQFVTRALTRSARQPLRLEYAVWLNERGASDDLPGAGETVAVSFPYDARDSAAKRAAIAAHRSQCGGVIDDDPTGFVLDPAMIARACDLPEIFYAPGAEPVDA